MANSTTTRTARVARLCADLTTLSPAELKDMQQRLNFLLGDGGANQASGETKRARARDERDWLLSGIEYELKRRRLLGQRSLTSAGVRRTVPNWDAISKNARDDLLRAFGDYVPKSRELESIGRLAAHALVEYLLSWRDPPHLEYVVLCRHANKVMAAVNAQFPGYAEAGLLSAILHHRMVPAGQTEKE